MEDVKKHPEILEDLPDGVHSLGFSNGLTLGFWDFFLYKVWTKLGLVPYGIIEKISDKIAARDSRRLFATETNLRDDFWAVIAEATGKHIFNGSSANEIISQLNLSSNIDANLNYDSINSIQNVPLIIQIFQLLGIDLVDFNAITIRHINITSYWIDKIKKKAQTYRPKYLANTTNTATIMILRNTALKTLFM